MLWKSLQCCPSRKRFWLLTLLYSSRMSGAKELDMVAPSAMAYKSLSAVDAVFKVCREERYAMMFPDHNATNPDCERPL